MIGFRPAIEHDRRFVIHSWLDSYRYSHAGGMIHNDDWLLVMRPQIERVLNRKTVDTIVAHETTDTEHHADLYGFIVADTSSVVPIVWYVYTKLPYRRSGIARRLFNAAHVDPHKPFEYACRTPASIAIDRHGVIPQGRCDLLLGRFPNREHHRRSA